MADELPLELRLQRLEILLAALLARTSGETDVPVAWLLAGATEQQRELFNAIASDTRDARLIERIGMLEQAFQKLAQQVNLLNRLVGSPGGLRDEKKGRKEGISMQTGLHQEVARIDAVLAEISESVTSASQLQSRHDRLRTQIERIDQQRIEEMIALEAAPALADARLIRHVTVDVYLDDPTQRVDQRASGRQAVAAVSSLMEIVGFDEVRRLTPRRGSFFQRFFMRSRETLTSKEVRERLLKVERAVELQRLQRIQAEVDLTLANGAAVLLDAIKDYQHAIFRMGSTVIMKRTAADGAVSVGGLSLSPRQMIELENHDPLIAFKDAHSLDDFLGRLGGGVDDETELGSG